MKFLSDKKWLCGLLSTAVFLFCLWLIITGQAIVGIVSLLKMIVGLVGLLVLLYFYNKSYEEK